MNLYSASPIHKPELFGTWFTSSQLSICIPCKAWKVTKVTKVQSPGVTSGLSVFSSSFTGRISAQKIVNNSLSPWLHSTTTYLVELLYLLCYFWLWWYVNEYLEHYALNSEFPLSAPGRKPKTWMGWPSSWAGYQTCHFYSLLRQSINQLWSIFNLCHPCGKLLPKPVKCIH